MDTVTPSKRSEIMRAIKSRGTKPETALEWALRYEGLWFGTQVRGAGVVCPESIITPDIAFLDSQVALFVHGCFWHGCERHYREPKSNVVFWREKIARNRRRDRRQRRELRAAGWRTLVVWEHDINRRLDSVVARVKRALRHRS